MSESFIQSLFHSLNIMDIVGGALIVIGLAITIWERLHKK